MAGSALLEVSGRLYVLLSFKQDLLLEQLPTACAVIRALNSVPEIRTRIRKFLCGRIININRVYFIAIRWVFQSANL
jgi:hypothetical protein